MNKHQFEIMVANIHITARKFEKENGKRNQKLQELRRAGKVCTPLFQRLYDAEDKWLKKNSIKWSPEFVAWYTELPTNKE